MKRAVSLKRGRLFFYINFKLKKLIWTWFHFPFFVKGAWGGFFNRCNSIKSPVTPLWKERGLLIEVAWKIMCTGLSVSSAYLLQFDSLVNAGWNRCEILPGRYDVDYQCNVLSFAVYFHQNKKAGPNFSPAFYFLGNIYIYFLLRIPAIPSKPSPRRISVAGSGTPTGLNSVIWERPSPFPVPGREGNVGI